MSLEAEHISWLDQFAAVKLDGDAAADKVEARRLTQSMIEFELADKRDQLRELLESVEAVKPPEGALEKVMAALGRAEKIRLLEPGGDPMVEFDIFHDSKMKDYMDPAALLDVQKRLFELVQLSERMATMTYGEPPDTKLVYDNPSQIAADLWQPLVREGALPENFVPKQYSEVETTFGAAAALYEERLQKATKELNTPGEIAKKFNVAAECLKLGFDIASAVTEATGAIDALKAGTAVKDLQYDEAFKSVEKTVKILDLVGASIAAVGQGAEMMFSEKDVVKTLDQFVVVLSKVLTGVFDKKVAAGVTNIVSAAVHSYPLMKRINDFRTKGEWDWASLIDDLGDVVSKSITAGDGKSGDTFYASIGKAVKAGFSGLKAGVQGLEGDKGTAAIAANFSAAAATIGTSVVSILKDQEVAKVKAAPGFKEMSEKEQDEAKEKASAKFEQIEGLLEGGDIVEKLAKAGEGAKKLDLGAIKDFDESEKKRLLAAASAAQTAQLKAYMETPDPVYEAMLVSSFSEDAYGDAPDDGDDSPEAAEKRAAQEERRINTLETLIAIQKKHQATYELSKTIIGLATKVGVAALKEVVPGIGIAPVATQMMFSMNEAAKQGREFLLWRDSVADASAAHTVQLDAIMNRHGLAEKQAIEAGIAAALLAAKFVGEVLKLAGHAAPAGYAVSAAASTGAALLEISSKVATELQIRTAWKDYKQALATPQDRKAIRTALRSNPTLAKYAMAYGAVIEGNPIAKEVMRRCGINDTTLADPGTNVAKVQTYLETLYKADPMVLEQTVVPKGWYPGEVALTGSSWTLFIYAAQNDKAAPAKLANPLLDPKTDATGVAGALKSFEDAMAAIDAATNDIAKYETVVRATAAIEQLDAAFLRFKPKALGDRPGPHAEVAAYAAVLQSMANLKRPELVALGTQLELDIEAAEAAELEKQAADAAQKTT